MAYRRGETDAESASSFFVTDTLNIKKDMP